ncbi:hypothetical protein [Neobacillus vireti]|uniref:hypothetical protein n=1 Tax=Neobacillus vireti TaxID=220686 RepID=UPI002FFD9FFA
MSSMYKSIISHKTNPIMEDAIHGMKKCGNQYSEELVRGDLDPVIRQLAKEVIDNNHGHAEGLKDHLNT